MIKNIIFDFDGTIGDSTALIVQCFQDTLSELNLRVCTAQECRETIGLPLRAAFVQLAGVDKDSWSSHIAITSGDMGGPMPDEHYAEPGRAYLGMFRVCTSFQSLL